MKKIILRLIVFLRPISNRLTSNNFLLYLHSLGQRNYYMKTHSPNDILDSCKSRINSNHNGCTTIVPHVCNNINVFGAGFAAYLSNRYPIIKENFHMLGNKAKLGQVQYVAIEKDKIYGHELIVANMIAQNKTINYNNTRPLNYEYLVKCMIDVRNFIHYYQDKYQTKVEIHCPKFGSGLAGGNWLFINELIKDIWKSIPIIVYNPPKKNYAKNN